MEVFKGIFVYHRKENRKKNEKASLSQYPYVHLWYLC